MLSDGDPGVGGSCPNVIPRELEAPFLASLAGITLEVTNQVRVQNAPEQTAEIRNRLLHLTSHELRGPLSAILGYAQLSRRHSSADQLREDLRIIHEQAIQLRDRLEMFVALSDLDDLEAMETIRIEVETADVSAIVEHDLSILRHAHPELVVDLVRNGDAVVQTDPRLLREILSSLLDNAAKYSGPSGRVLVRVAPTLSGAVVEVCDDGPGISPEQQSRLFEPGFRTDAARASGIVGEGLGLFVAGNLLKRLGGSFSVVSELGAGASFFVHLPHATPAATAPVVM